MGYLSEAESDFKRLPIIQILHHSTLLRRCYNTNIRVKSALKYLLFLKLKALVPSGRGRSDDSLGEMLFIKIRLEMNNFMCNLLLKT